MRQLLRLGGGSDTYTKIDKVADLAAGTYYMAGYLTANGNTDFSANPYHLFTGSVGNTTYGGECYTTPYSFAEGVLTIKAEETYEAAEVTLEAVEGKENTYYLKSSKGYFYSVSYANNKINLGDDTKKVEWVASDSERGGIIFTTPMVDEANDNAPVTINLGTGNASTKIIRSYKAATTLKCGLYFFKKN